MGIIAVIIGILMLLVMIGLSIALYVPHHQYSTWLPWLWYHGLIMVKMDVELSWAMKYKVFSDISCVFPLKCHDFCMKYFTYFLRDYHAYAFVVVVLFSPLFCETILAKPIITCLLLTAKLAFNWLLLTSFSLINFHITCVCLHVRSKAKVSNTDTNEKTWPWPKKYTNKVGLMLSVSK